MKDNSVNLKLDQATWDILDEIHKETGISKSTQISNFIKNTMKNKESVIKNNIDELEKIATAKLEEAERLFNLKDAAVSQRQDIKFVRKYADLKSKKKKGRKPSNQFAFTDESVSNLKHEGRDLWHFDTETSGLAIRTKKVGKAYYTRAKNPRISSYAIRVKIGDTDNISIEQAKKIHKDNLKTIFEDNINPNTLNPQAKWTRDNVNVAYVEEKDKKATTNWKLYTSLKYDDGLCFPILKAIAKRHPELVDQCKSKYMNRFYSIRGERILDMFKNEEMNVFEISAREMIEDKRGQHKIRRMSIQNVIVQILKGFYWHGTKQEIQSIFGEK